MPSATLLAIITAAVAATHAAIQDDDAAHVLAYNAIEAHPVQQTMTDDEPSWDSTPFDQNRQYKDSKRWEIENPVIGMSSSPEPANGPQIVVISEEAEIVIVLPDATATYNSDFLQPQQTWHAAEPNKRQVASTTNVTSTATVAQPTSTVVLLTTSQASTSTTTQVVSTTSVTQASPTITSTITTRPYPEAQISVYLAQESTWRSSQSYYHTLKINDEVKHSAVVAASFSKITAVSRLAADATSSETALKKEFQSAESSWKTAHDWIARSESAAKKNADVLSASASNLRAAYTSVPHSAAVSTRVPFEMLTGSGIAAVMLLGLAIVL